MISIENLADVTDDEFIALYKQMWQIRIFEETVQEQFELGEIYGTMHLCIGEEATAVGSASLLRQDDWITSTHRNHGHGIAKGTDIHAMMAEMLGRSTGTNEGKGGSMHIADLDVGHLGSNGIVGGGFPIATGAALTAQMKDTDQVVICYAGDGSTNEGSFHEAMNLAAIWKLPVIFFIENNHYAMSSPFEEMFNTNKISDRASGYGIEGVSIDGNDLVSVIDTTFKAIEKARNGDGPTLIEAFTYRHCGHSKSDKRVYRTREEEEEWMTHNDPIKRTQDLLVQKEILTQKESETIEQDVRSELKKVVEACHAEPRPAADSLMTHVYAEDWESI